MFVDLPGFARRARLAGGHTLVELLVVLAAVCAGIVSRTGRVRVARAPEARCG